jgi:hypothetical protein
VRFHFGRRPSRARAACDERFAATPTNSPSVTSTTPARLSSFAGSMEASVAPMAGGRRTRPYSISDGLKGAGLRSLA